MAIRDHFRRAVHKSTSSTSSATISPAESNTTLNSTPGSLRKTKSTVFGRTFTWGRIDKDSELERQREEEKERKRKERAAAKKSNSGGGKKKTPMHPRDKPLTATNIRHQEMLSHFTMTFGSSLNSSRLSFDGGISPCCTRPGSIMLDDEDTSSLEHVYSQGGRRYTLGAAY